MKKLIAWVKARRRPPSDGGDELGPRREFVYLDEVSAYSLLASRQGSIPEQLTSSVTESLWSEINASIGASAPPVKAEIGAKSGSSSTSATQVIRKSMVQGAFKELVDTERDKLSLPRPPDLKTPPIFSSLAELEAGAADAESPWVFDPSQLCRGELLEIEIELDADASFAFSIVISEVVKFMDQNPELFPGGLEGLAAGETMNKILAQLMVGLVPLRCKVLDYRALALGGKEFLVHQRALPESDLPAGAEVLDVHLVGVAEESLFWKDLRRVLFSRSRFTVMCRLGNDGLQDKWSPVKLTEVFKKVFPPIGEQLEQMLGGMMSGFQSGAAEALQAPGVDTKMRTGMEEYARLYAAEFPDASFDVEILDGLLEPAAGIDYEQVSLRREALEPLTARLRETLNQKEDRELEARVRNEAMEIAGFGLGEAAPEALTTDEEPAVPSAARLRLLDTEFVAIYW